MEKYNINKNKRNIKSYLYTERKTPTLKNFISNRSVHPDGYL